MERRGLNIRKGFLKAVLPVIRTLPLPMASRVLVGFGRLEYRLSPVLRRSFQEAVERGCSVLGCQWDVRAVSQELASNHILWRTRDMLLDGVPDRRADGMFVVNGRDNLDAAAGSRAWLYRSGQPLWCSSPPGPLAVSPELPSPLLHGTSPAYFALHVASFRVQRPARTGKALHLASRSAGRFGQLHPPRCQDSQSRDVALLGR